MFSSNLELGMQNGNFGSEVEDFHILAEHLCLPPPVPPSLPGLLYNYSGDACCNSSDQ